DHREVSAGMGTSEFIALRAQAGHDALAVDQRLRAAERDETHSRRARRGMSVFHGEGLGQPWLWTLAYGHHEDRTPIYGYEPTREAAMAAFAKSWRRREAPAKNWHRNWHRR